MFLGTFRAGGAERVAAALCNSLAEAGHEVSLITIDDSASDFYPLDPRVVRIGLGLLAKPGERNRALRSNLLRLRRLRNVLRTHRPDVCVSFITQANVLALTACLSMRIPIVVAERIDPRMHREPLPWRLLRWCTYRFAARLVIQTEGIRAWAEGLVPRDRIVTIPNPITWVTSPAASQWDADSNASIVAVGRLDRQKGFDLLIDAFSLIAPQLPQSRLTIYGEGPERGALERRVQELGLTTRVSLAGLTRDVASTMTQATVVVLSSRYEGFPNVLLEAMSLSVPVIAFDCPSGPRELIDHEVNGLLVPHMDVQALASAMLRMLSDTELRGRISARAADVKERYSLRKVSSMWENLLTDVSLHAKGK